MEQQLSKTFQAEYSNLVAVLCHFYGIQNIQLAEDIISDTFLQAMKVWSHKGVPDNPKAWLRKVAINKYKDHFRREKLFQEKIQPQLTHAQKDLEEIVLDEQIISDGLLNMIFAICNANLKIETQICLALRLLCGFSIEQIATALLSNKETINKKLYRGKQTLKKYRSDWNTLQPNDYITRIGPVLRIIYLLFNEGYYSHSSDQNVKQELCWEAMRLALFLTEQSFLPQQDTQALIVLMCFHASRMDSRLSPTGQHILYLEQNRQKWNKDLIRQGELYLSRSAKGNKVSKYHLEAAIAYWHTTDADNKWNQIVLLYDQLLNLEQSPIIAMNRIYALARSSSVSEALQEAKALNLDSNYYYWLMAELYRLNQDSPNEIQFLNRALATARNKEEARILKEKLDKALQTSS